MSRTAVVAGATGMVGHLLLRQLAGSDDYTEVRVFGRRAPAQAHPKLRFVETPPAAADIVITDSWPSGIEDPSGSLTEQHLARMGHPRLLPTPPFSIGRELSFDPLAYAGFVGYQQKELLLPVQTAIVRHVALAPTH